MSDVLVEAEHHRVHYRVVLVQYDTPLSVETAHRDAMRNWSWSPVTTGPEREAFLEYAATILHQENQRLRRRVEILEPPKQQPPALTVPLDSF